jgi:hypothetical protein
MVAEKALASCPVRTGVAAMGNAIAYLLIMYAEQIILSLMTVACTKI